MERYSIPSCGIVCCLCNAYPGPRSVVVINNTSIHHSEVSVFTIATLVLSSQPYEVWIGASDCIAMLPALRGLTELG